MLHNDDHMVIIVREDFDGVTYRKGDIYTCFSLFHIRESRGYYVYSQHLSDVFPLGGVETSSTDETTRYGVNHEMWSFVGHIRGKMEKMMI